MKYCQYCHQSTKQNRYHPLTCGQCGAEYKDNSILAGISCDEATRNIQDYIAALNEIPSTIYTEVISGMDLQFGDMVYMSDDGRAYVAK